MLKLLGNMGWVEGGVKSYIVCKWIKLTSYKYMQFCFIGYEKSILCYDIISICSELDMKLKTLCC